MDAKTRKLIEEITEMAARVNATFAPDRAKIRAWILAHRGIFSDKAGVGEGQ